MTTASTAVPLRAVVISIAALTVPFLYSLALPEAGSDYEILVWLLALVPAFLLAYYRGWQGATTALAAGMATLSVTQAVLVALDRQIERRPLLLTFTAAYVGLVLAIGYLSEALHRARSEAERMALTDPVTGLPNRRHAWSHMEREFAAAQRGRPLCVVLFDLDRFKDYNDTHGHAAGDLALRVFGECLVHSTRRMNLSARFGGEEFISIVSDATPEAALIFVERVRKRLAETLEGSPPFTVSAGVAAYSREIQTPEELVAAADRALYRAKAEGRDRAVVSGAEGIQVSGRLTPSGAS